MTAQITHSLLLIWVLPLVRQTCGATRISSPISDAQWTRTNVNRWINNGGEAPSKWTVRDTTASSAATVVCPYLTECQADGGCAACLSAVLPTLRFVQSTQGEAEVETIFFQTLAHTPSCTNMSTSAIGAGPILYNALVELYSTSGGPTPCSNAMEQVYVYVCEIEEFVCFLDADCRTCFSGILSSSHYGVALDTAACRATNTTLLAKLVDGNCYSFPSCSFSKQRCKNSTMCTECSSLLTGGDGAGAASRCPNGESAMLIDSTVYWCVDSTTTSCTFWQTRCLADELCGPCLRQMNFGHSVEAIVAASTTRECTVLRNNRSTSSAASGSFETLWNVASMCPEQLAFTDCGALVMICVLTYEQCAECVNGSTSESCGSLLNKSGYGIDTACLPCPDAVVTINLLVIATTVIGSVSMAACLCVVVAIIAHGRDLVSMRDRIIIGLMAANAVYSAANAIPTGQLHTGVGDCGHFEQSFATIRFGRALWFYGKYAIVSFEIFIVGSSMWALRYGARTVSKCAEAAMHATCTAVGTAAFVTFYILSGDAMHAHGFNAATQAEATSNAYVVPDHAWASRQTLIAG